LRPKAADIRPLKEWAQEELPVHSTLRSILLVEPDTMDPRDFLKKVPLFTRLYRKEKVAFEKAE
jgi:hypothetical protein